MIELKQSNLFLGFYSLINLMFLRDILHDRYCLVILVWLQWCSQLDSFKTRLPSFDSPVTLCASQGGRPLHCAPLRCPSAPLRHLLDGVNLPFPLNVLQPGAIVVRLHHCWLWGGVDYLSRDLCKSHSHHGYSTGI